MRLFIAEKPSLARAIAAVLPQPQKASRLYIEAGNDVVAWAAGHLLEQAMPEQYDEKYKRWNLADLPIIPEEWKMLVKKESRDLFDNLKALLKKADSVVNAGDCDREGQLLIDEIASTRDPCSASLSATRTRTPCEKPWPSSSPTRTSEATATPHGRAVRQTGCTA